MSTAIKKCVENKKKDKKKDISVGGARARVGGRCATLATIFSRQKPWRTKTVTVGLGFYSFLTSVFIQAALGMGTRAWFVTFIQCLLQEVTHARRQEVDESYFPEQLVKAFSNPTVAKALAAALSPFLGGAVKRGRGRPPKLSLERSGETGGTSSSQTDVASQEQGRSPSGVADIAACKLAAQDMLDTVSVRYWRTSCSCVGKLCWQIEIDNCIKY